MAIDAAHAAVRRFYDEPAGESEAERREAALEPLRLMYDECERVQKAAGDYPRGVITADVWMDGSGLALLAERLAERLQELGLTDLEEQAHTLRCVAVLAIQSHYRHLVGPAMLARAECNERLGNGAFAGELHRAVVLDFVCLLDNWEGADEGPTGDDRAALVCLAAALDGVAEHRPEGIDLDTIPALQARCAALLALPVD